MSSLISFNDVCRFQFVLLLPNLFLSILFFYVLYIFKRCPKSSIPHWKRPLQLRNGSFPSFGWFFFFSLRIFLLSQARESRSSPRQATILSSPRRPGWNKPCLDINLLLKGLSRTEYSFIPLSVCPSIHLPLSRCPKPGVPWGTLCQGEGDRCLRPRPCPRGAHSLMCRVRVRQDSALLGWKAAWGSWGLQGPLTRPASQ